MPDWPAVSAWHAHAPFAFWLVEALAPDVVVELGVYGGFSYFTLCQATAAHSPSARLYGIDTWQGDEHAGEIPPGMRRNVEARNELYQPRSTLVASTFDAALDRFAEGEVDLLHIDGVHTYEAVRHDLESWLPKMSSKGVVLLHDTEVRERGFGVWRLMDELETRYPSFRFLHGHGLGVVGVGPEIPRPVRALFEAADAPTTCRVVQDVYALLGKRVGTRHGANAPPWDDSQPVPGGSDWLRETLEARARMRTAERRLGALYSSRSWKVTVPLRQAAAGARRARGLVHSIVGDFLLVNADARRKAREAEAQCAYETGSDAYANWVRDYDALDAADRAGMAELDASLVARPMVSIVMPVYNPNLRLLEQVLDSVLGQVYANWQLCIADDASTDPSVRPLLARYASRDSRIEVVHREANGGIAIASNSALELTRGEIITLLDQDDLLRPHSLLLVAHWMTERPELGCVYSDEDKIDENDLRHSHYFKSDWNPELLRSQNYLCHLAAFRADLLRLVGGFRTEFEGSQDWDLALRIVERLRDDQIGHIPHVLYHKRAVSTSAPSGASGKPCGPSKGRAAVTDHLRRVSISGVVTAGTHQNVRYALPADLPLVSVVVPTTMKDGRFETLLRGLLGTDYGPIEVVRVTRPDRIERSPIEALVPPRWKSRDVPYRQEEFNFARAINLGSAAATGPLLLLANDDLEVLHADWLRLMVGHVCQNRVAVVGPLLLYPDESVQHAGALIGAGNAAAHLYAKSSVADHGYASRRQQNQDLSCVTAACMLVRKDVFEELGGFDESFVVAYNDVDFCLRIRQRGLRVVFTPEAVLIHHESASFGSHWKGRREAYEGEVRELWRRWRPNLLADPAHNPNLALDAFQPWHLAFPPRVQYPWRDPNRRPPGVAMISEPGSARAS